jgi:putative tryptophan/tyrosine transport system substrate-binding protein
MKRRAVITLIGAATAWAFGARAQQPDRFRRIGWLEQGHADDPTIQARIAAVRQELEQLGWVVGRNLQIDYRYGVTSFEMAKRLGAELLNLSPDANLLVVL